ncbi:hypothetical protein [Kiritimatiella glycovorans]|uniref:Uncharacterized protein n=1 Tax=Kiritimatiella glycovorans TaxID=1307763 RepID=A0A0G3EGC4_9BACT|nr:hypothetical protein [Kiritimatiella glycovorans]AKJ64457.1 hypothetical protein L21SP4_01209 [Kiritimatiella glycovorans]
MKIRSSMFSRFVWALVLLVLIAEAAYLISLSAFGFERVDAFVRETAAELLKMF